MSMLLWASAVSWLLAFVLLSFTWIKWHRGLKPWRDITSLPKAEVTLSVTVIVCFHNEEANAPNILRDLADQDYTNVELLLVDDRSTDGTAALLASQSAKDPRFRVITIRQTPKGWTSKKWAVRTAIEAAKTDYVLLTDADCRLSLSWVHAMVYPFTQGADVVLGYSPYEQLPSLLNRLIQFETYLTAVRYLTLDNPVRMAVGRCLGYKKSVFEASNRYDTHRTTHSGDDDLFIQQLDPSTTIVPWYLPEAWAISEPMTTWRAWVYQKLRHLGASSHYKPEAKFKLAIEALAHVLLALPVFLSLSLLILPWGASVECLAVFAIYCVAVAWLFRPTKSSLLKPSWGISLPILHLLYAVYLLVVVPVGILRNQSWKK
jgi:glycosyltransferase involved in cell wall biosynthesis